MPQRISDVALTRLLEFHAESRHALDLALDLRDARAEIVALTNERNGWGDRCQEAEALLIIAVGALEKINKIDENEAGLRLASIMCDQMGGVAQTALDRIKGIS